MVVFVVVEIIKVFIKVVVMFRVFEDDDSGKEIFVVVV